MKPMYILETAEQATIITGDSRSYDTGPESCARLIPPRGAR